MSASEARPAAGSTAAAVAAFVGAAIAATWPVAIQPARWIPGGLGDPMLCTVILAWVADRARHGFRAVWDAPYLFPHHHTLAYAEHLFGIAIFATPLEWLSSNPVLVYNAAFAGSYVLAGFGMFLLARSLTGRSEAAFVAGLMFALTPYRFSQTTHLQVLVASAWMPVALLGLHRWCDRGGWKWILLFTAGYLLTSLSSTYFMYFLLVPIAVVGALELLAPRQPRPVTIAALAASALAAAAVLGPIGAVYFRLQRERGFVRPPEELPGLSAQLSDYFRVAYGSWNWFGVLPPGANERTLFPGFVVLSLGALGGAVALLRSSARGRSGLSRRDALAYVAIAVLAVVFSMGPGPFRPYGVVLRFVPGMSGLRVPARLAIVVVLALSVLAAGALAWLFERLPRRHTAVIATAIGCLVIAEGQHGGVYESEVPAAAARTWERVAYEWLAASPPGGTLELDITRMNDLAPFTTTYQLEAVRHKHPIVNGYAGWSTPLQELLGGASSPLRESGEVPQALAGLRSIGVRYVLLHETTYADPREASRVASEIHGASDQWDEEHRFGSTWAWRLRAAAIPSPGGDGAIEIDPRTLRIDASQARSRVEAMTDGDIGTRWLTGAPQDGREWVSVELPRPANIARIRMELQDRTIGDYPRRIVIDASDAAGRRRVLFDGAIAARAVAAAAEGVSRFPIDVPLPENETASFVIRQRGQSRASWSIHELSVWERTR